MVGNNIRLRSTAADIRAILTLNAKLTGSNGNSCDFTTKSDGFTSLLTSSSATIGGGGLASVRTLLTMRMDMPNRARYTAMR